MQEESSAGILLFRRDRRRGGPRFPPGLVLPEGFLNAKQSQGGT